MANKSSQKKLYKVFFDASNKARSVVVAPTNSQASHGLKKWYLNNGLKVYEYIFIEAYSLENAKIQGQELIDKNSKSDQTE